MIKNGKSKKKNTNGTDDDDGDDIKGKVYCTYRLKIILFGGYDNKDVLSSFLILDVLLPYYFASNKESYELINVSIDETLIDKNTIRLNNMKKLKCDIWKYFGFECMINSNNEPIIIIIGGFMMNRNIHLFNCATNELTLKNEILPFDGCDYYPAVSKHNNGQSIFIVQQHNYCLFNIAVYYLNSRIEKTIWIAFYKNKKNKKCLLSKLPKDSILYLLFLLGKKEMVAKPFIAI